MLIVKLKPQLYLFTSVNKWKFFIWKICYILLNEIIVAVRSTNINLTSDGCFLRIINILQFLKD